MARIILNTFGSLGDLHPYLAIAIELRRRGHDPVLATSAVYRQKIEAEGVRFAAVRPDVGELLGNEEFLGKLWHPLRGTEYLYRDYLLPAIEGSYEDLSHACNGADLLLTHFAACAGPVVAAVRKLPWLSVALQPTVFLSKTAPPVLAIAPWLKHLYPLQVFPLFLALGRIISKNWIGPVVTLRRRLGLAEKENPLFEGQFSPFGTLALFSPEFAAPQPDWPPCTTVTGFVFYDNLGEGLGANRDGACELVPFLDSGSPPIVFTLGSSAVMHPGTFFEESAAAARRLNLRAVLLKGSMSQDCNWDGSIYVACYAPFSELMPRAIVNVHQGGIGTTAQALRAGKPMIVVPWSHDQPDNAERLLRLGVARIVPRGRYQADRLAREIEILLKKERYARRAAEIGRKIAEEGGLTTACDAIEAVVDAGVR